jgi:hypothetical protein
MKVPSLLKNKYVFYGLAVLAVLNVVGYVSVRAYECLALFVLTAYSAHCYCKNESLAVLAALFVANFIFGCGRVKEGFEDALKGPMEHMADAEESERKAKEAFTTASKENCCATQGEGDNQQFTGAWKDFQGTDAEKTAKAALCSAQGTAGEYCTN